MNKSSNEIMFDKIFQGTLSQVKSLFDSSVIGFSTIGPKIDMDAACEYVNNIIDDINKKAPDDTYYQDYLKLSVCYLVLSFIDKFEEDTFEDGSEEIDA